MHYKSKLLGEVPAINLLRAGNGAVVRFAGKNWVVQRASRDGITVLPASRAQGAVDFVYPGKGPPTGRFSSQQNVAAPLRKRVAHRHASLAILWITYQPCEIIFAVAARSSRFPVFRGMAVPSTLRLPATWSTRRLD